MGKKQFNLCKSQIAIMAIQCNLNLYSTVMQDNIPRRSVIKHPFPVHKYDAIQLSFGKESLRTQMGELQHHLPSFVMTRK